MALTNFKTITQKQSSISSTEPGAAHASQKPNPKRQQLQPAASLPSLPFSFYFCLSIMINSTEQDEREYLEEIKEKLLLAIRRVDERVKQFSSELRQTKAYLHEHQSGLDEADMVAAGQSINRMAFTGESAVAAKRKLMKLHQSPYFGRIDFAVDNAEATP